MSKDRLRVVASEPPPDQGDVLPLRAAAQLKLAPIATAWPPRRETSWRDLVRRLAKNLAKR